MPRRIILKTGLPPGDLCTLTAAIQSLHDSFPGWFYTDVRTSCDALFENNPHITPLVESRAAVIDCHYTQTINTSNQVASFFLRGYCLDLGRKLGIPLDLATNRPHLFLSDEEKLPLLELDGIDLPSNYWMMNAGIKNDFTLKQWPVEYYQAVVDHFRGRVHFIQIGGEGDDHPKLDGVWNIIGKTNMRQLMRLAYHAAGGVGPVTLLQHLCAGFQRPYIALLGGREPVTWTQYPLQTTLHTMGRLPCCRTTACWRSRVVPLGDGDEKDRSLCEMPVLAFSRPVGKCMSLIKPEDVIRAIERGDENGLFVPATA